MNTFHRVFNNPPKYISIWLFC